MSNAATSEIPGGGEIGTSAEPAVGPSVLRAAWLWTEMCLLFFAIPGLVALAFAHGYRPPILPILGVFAIGLTLWLVFDPSFPNRQLWNWRPFRGEFWRIMATFAIGACLLVLAAIALDLFTTIMDVTTRNGRATSALFRLPREAPIILLFIAIGYPWLSAFPQEITHRAFFFHRYRPILPGRWSMILVNTVAFAWLHIPFLHWMALAVTLPGGLLFAWTYDRTRSTLAATFEHAIFGWWVFFTGLGWFVFTGSIGSGSNG